MKVVINFYECKKCNWRGKSKELKKDNLGKKIWKCPNCNFQPLKLMPEIRKLK